VERPLGPQRLLDWTAAANAGLHGSSLGAVDDLSPGAVAPRLRGRLGRPYRFEASCASTQRLLDGESEGAVAAADFQTEGRGRLGRRWEAPPGSSLMFSVVLEPAIPPERLPELTPLAGAAVADSIAALTGLATSVKEPNDVLVDGRKVAGILGEAVEGRVVLGIGVNVTQRADELPERPVFPATSLALEGIPADRAELLVEILARLEERYGAWRTALLLPAES
jgi:BirA family transcriptional regulator, biotin operon repressor / biotin---[acetyl-CoA-carboxylase] ligase